MVGLNTWHRSARRPPQRVDCFCIPPLFLGSLLMVRAFTAPWSVPTMASSLLDFTPSQIPSEDRYRSFGVLPSNVVERGSSVLVHQVPVQSHTRPFHEPWYDRVPHLNVKPRLRFQIVLERPELFLKALDGILRFSV